MFKSAKMFIISLMATTVVLVGIGLIMKKTPEYKITFNSNGGNQITEQIIKEGETVTKPNDPSKDGYTFVMWQYHNTEYNFSDAVTSDMTLDATWEKVEEIVKYEITFILEEQTKTISVSSNEEIDLDSLGFEDKVGYVIKWYIDGVEYDFTKPITTNLTIKGKYEKTGTYTVKFNSNGGNSVPSQTVKVNGKATKPSNVKKEGYKLDGWYLNNIKYDFNTPVTKNITLKAIWSEDSSVKRYEVSFDSDGGSKVASQRVIVNHKVTEPANPIKNGFKFSGWYLDNKKYDFNSKVTKNITLKAKWEEIKKYTVTFNSNGGSTVASVTILEGEKVTKPSNPTKKDYIFKEWQLDGKAYDFNSKVTKNITLSAVWEKIKGKYTVTFNSDGGTTIPSQVVIEGEKATKPTDPTKTNYNFLEWQLNGQTYDFNSPVKSNITLKAKWQEKDKPIVKYTVKFDSNGGSNVASQTVNAGSKVTKPANPTRTNYRFTGWKLKGNTYDFNTPVNSNITLVASWEELPKYTVTFDSNGGSSVPSKTVYEGSKVAKPSNPAKAHYNFSSWKLNGNTYNFNTPVNSNITLTASWTQKKFTLKKVPIDNLSVQCKLTLYEETTKISFRSFPYGNHNITPNSGIGCADPDMSSNKTFQVTLTDGTVVSAKVA